MVGFHMNKKHLLVFLFVLLSLLAITLIVIHAATPNVFHALAFRPEIFNRH